jgi:putative ABC transport system permease protein
MAGIEHLLPELEKIWTAHYPGNPFDYFFLDDFYNEQYRADERFSGLFLASSILAIIIACLGLSGLSAYAIIRRTKEVGIRKTNGARILQVMILLNKDFVKWVGIAFVIAVPVAWFIMNKWLENYAYRIELSWLIFAIAGITALVIALLTVSWQSWKAAVRNPVEALRYE